MRANFKKFFVVLFLTVISSVNAQFESNYGYFEDEEPSYGSLDDNIGIFSSGDNADPYNPDPGDIIRYSSIEFNPTAPIDDYILPIILIGLGLGMYYKKQMMRS